MATLPSWPAVRAACTLLHTSGGALYKPAPFPASAPWQAMPTPPSALRDLAAQQRRHDALPATQGHPVRALAGDTRAALMSALGHQRTSEHESSMSASPP